MEALEKGKKYMFNAKKAKKNKVALYGEKGAKVEFFNWNAGQRLMKTGQMTPQPVHVMWTETDPFEAEYEDGMGIIRKSMFQQVRVCRPFNGFEITEMIFSYPGPLIFITEAMPAEGQKVFEDKFIDDSLVEIMNDLW